MGTSWYNSAMNYDMLSQFPGATANLHMNQLWDDSLARQNMFAVPSYNFNSFTPYGGIMDNSYLTNPMYTVRMSAWGTPAWNDINNGNYSNLWNNNGNMWGNVGGNMWGNMGWNGGNANGPDNNSNLSAEEKGFQRKYNTLLGLVKQLKTYDGLSNSQKDALDVASRGSKGTWEEKYKALKEAYDKIDKDTIKEFVIENSHKLGVSKDIKGNTKDKDSFYNRLLGCGFEYEDAGADEILDRFCEGIKQLRDGNATSPDVEGIIAYFNENSDGKSTYDILDFVSSWNNEYKKEGHVIDHIAKYYNKIGDKDQLATAKSKILAPLVSKMIDKANSVKGSLDESSKEKMSKAIEDLRTALDNTKTEKNSKVDSKLSKAFDKVYLLTRQAAMITLRNDVKGYYGEVDSEVFNDELFEKETTDDLKNEGFSDAEINNTEVKISEKKAKKAEKGENAESKDIDKKTAVEQVAKLKADGIIEELNVKSNGYTMYREKNMTGGSNGDGKADYAKLFYINKDGKLVEWKNKKFDGKQFVTINPEVKTESVEVKASEIKKATVDVTEEKAEEDTDDDYNASAAGEKVAKCLEGWTSTAEQKTIARRLNTDKLTKNNIYDFLDAYYTETKYDREGIIEFLDDDGGEAVTLEMKQNIIESTLEKAKEMGLTKEESYTELNDIYNEWKNDHGSDNFNQTYSNDHWYINWFGGLWTNYNEAIDRQLEELFKKMKEKQGK